MLQQTPDQTVKTPACIARGTLIDTYHGSMPVEDLSEDDLVMTKDAGFQPLRWIGSVVAAAKGRLSPVRISRGALGNSRTLLVSQQQRILLSDWRAELLFGEREVLVTARSLVDESTIWLQDGSTVEYFHLLFDRHQIIYAEDCPSESLHPANDGISGLPAFLRDEIFDRRPDLAEGLDGYGACARLILRPYEVKALRDYGA